MDPNEYEDEFLPAPEESERFFQCPWCWQQISVLVEPAAAEQDYVEDCEVCCRPIRLRVGVDGQLDAEAEGD